MTFHIGLDIGGTKIAGAVFSSDGREIAQKILPTPSDYAALVKTCADLVRGFDKEGPVGVGVPGAVIQKTGMVPVAANTPCLSGKPLREDLKKVLNRPVVMANDADCAALSEAIDGAGAGHRTVFGLILGTGVGGGLVVDGKIVEGPDGLTGEFGHIPLPFREAGDGPFADCVCRQQGCIDKSISGLALARLYTAMTGKPVDTSGLAELVRVKDAETLRVLDRFYTVIAKGMVPIIHMLDPEVIVVSGGLSSLPGLYEAVTQRWENYTISGNLKTKFLPARHGTMSGLRGAAWLGKAV